MKFKVDVVPDAWIKAMRAEQRAVAGPAVGALVQVANNAVEDGRAQIAASGRFSGSWQTGLKARMRDAKADGEPSLQAKAIVFHSIGLAGIFEHGATIAGKPMLWIPIDPRAPPASRSGKKLTSATVNGTPLLFDANDPDRHRKPLYVGVPSVRIPKKFRITEIVKQHAQEIGMLFLKHFKDK